MPNTCAKCGKVLTPNEPVYVVFGCEVESYSNRFTVDAAHLQMLGIMCRKCYELKIQEKKSE